MARISELEKGELLEDAACDRRRKDFATISQDVESLSPMEYLEFLTWAGFFMRESPEDRHPIIEKVMLL
jgi:hypothetical protein